jgi:predicted RNA methylase
MKQFIITEQVADVLKQAECSENTLKLRLQLERKLYLDVMKVIEALGGKWSRKHGAHVFPEPAWDRIADVITTRVVEPEESAKVEFQFYPTPSGLAAKIVRLAGIQRQHRTLEPSAGSGSIIKEIGIVTGPLTVFFCEIQEDLRKEVEKLPGVKFLCADFRDLPEEEKFDRIVANPPFRKGQDIDHVLKMWTHLAPGGRLVAVTSPAWTYRTDSRHVSFRRWFQTYAEAGAARYETLPAGTFRDSGTMVTTTLLTIEKG